MPKLKFAGLQRRKLAQIPTILIIATLKFAGELIHKAKLWKGSYFTKLPWAEFRNLHHHSKDYGL